MGFKSKLNLFKVLPDEDPEAELIALEGAVSVLAIEAEAGPALGGCC